MQRITKYKQADDGTYTAVISGLTLGNDETQLLDAGYDIAVEVSVYDPYKITDKQRRKVFALVNDIEAHTGTPREYMRAMFMDYLKALQGTEERISLSNCSKRTASDLIGIIMQWIFREDIPLNYKTSDLMKEDNYFIYLSTINRKCVICGTVNSDLAHREAVGSGRNRNKVNHIGERVLALCRRHHSEQHQLGVDGFDKLHHLENSWVTVDEKLNKMMKGVSNGST